jgi:hypothetical protein
LEKNELKNVFAMVQQHIQLQGNNVPGSNPAFPRKQEEEAKK